MKLVFLHCYCAKEKEKEEELAMVQITVLKVNFTCDNDRKKLLKAVSGIRGVDRVEIDVNKGYLVVTGNADPYKIIRRTQKTGRFVEVLSVGPPPPPQKPANEPKKPDDTNIKLDEKKPDKKPPVSSPPQSQPKDKIQAQLQFNTHIPSQAHTHVQSPNPCPVCQHMYMYQPPAWTSPVPLWGMGGHNYF